MKTLLGALVLLVTLPLSPADAQESRSAPAVLDAQSNADRVLSSATEGEPISGDDIETFLHWMSISKTQGGVYERWIPSIGEIADTETKSRAIVLVAMGLAAKGEASQSFQLIDRYREQIKTTYMDNLPSNHSHSSLEMLAAYYGWLVNNTVFSVPGAFVESYPDVFFRHTPVWGATRDAYFQVTLPEDSREWLDVFSDWRSLLSDVMNPAGGHIGSMFNMVHKNNLQNIALIEYRPELYSSYVEASDRASWLDSWEFLGPYEEEVKSEIDRLETQLKRLLVERLAGRHDLRPENAEVTVSTFIHQIQSNFFGVANERYAKDTESLTRIVSDSGWMDAVSSVDKLHPKAADFQLQIIGGYLISNGEFRQLERYINWLTGHGFGSFLKRLSQQSDGYSEYFVDDESGQAIAATLTGNLAAQDSNGLGAIMEWIRFDYDQWGSFNKNPAMYAAHHNNYVSYKILRNSRPELLENTTVGGDSGVPEIYGRNVLTYALENAEFDFIAAVLSDVGELFVPKVDSAGRNAFFYLGLNEAVSAGERNELVSRIQGLGLPSPNASFDCTQARRRIELLTCGSSTFAAMDQDLSAAYFAAREQADDPEGLLDEQRRWLSGALDCVLENGFESCYSSRASELAERTN